jgi:hypothetical protein
LYFLIFFVGLEDFLDFVVGVSVDGYGDGEEEDDGLDVGLEDGSDVGCNDGCDVGLDVGSIVGCDDGCEDGTNNLYLICISPFPALHPTLAEIKVPLVYPLPPPPPPPVPYKFHK